MSNSLLFHTQGIRGFDHLKWDWSGGQVTASIIRRKNGFSCSRCRSSNVTATPVSRRTVRAMPLGNKPFDLDVRMHRLKCHDCGAYLMESLPFISSPRMHITRTLERTLVELRAEMSISAVASYFKLDWKTAKEAEKRHLQRKYRTIRLADVQIIGIDEIHIGRSRYKTIVRDLQSGAVLHVGDGRGAEALKRFQRRLASSSAQIETVAMDMAAGYAAWVRDCLPDATVVYDHFHLIKLMNDKVDAVRRRTVAELEQNDAKALKKDGSCS